MQKTLDALPYIKSTEYISKEQAVKELEEELGENPETFLGFNPLQASIEVKLHSEYANVDSLQLIEKKIKKYTSVSDLLYRKDMMQMVNDNVKRVSLILLTLAVMLMAISFVLISNTIRLLIYSKRFLIHTMKLVGATPGFIRRPFVRYNVVSGIFAMKPSVLMVTFGMNDSGYFEYNGDKPKEFGEQKYQESIKNYQQMEKRFKDLPDTRIVMVGTSPYDETVQLKENTP